MSSLRLALRQLAQAPGFTAAALLTLAVGIGAATVVFSAINAFLYKPLPHIEAAEDRLVYATQVNRLLGNDDLGWNYADFAALRERATTLDGIWLHADRTVIISGGDRPWRLQGTEITWDAFALMGLSPRHGRAFSAADAAIEAPPAALISHAFWKSRLGGKADVIGSVLTLNREPVTIVGIMPRGWRYPDNTDIWTVLRTADPKYQHRGYFTFSARARLKPGVTLAAAQAEADAILGTLEKDFPATNTGIGVKLRPIREEAVQETAGLTGLLFGAVMFVFLIACVNVANLLLARAASRSKEFALRIALGASRGHVIRQLLTESVVLALLGGVGGLIVGLWGVDAMKAVLPIQIPFWLNFEFDGRVFGFVFALSLLAALLFGLGPALRISRPDLVHELKEGGRSVETSGPRAQRLRNLLVVLEVALALVLLVGAGLTLRSVLELQRRNPGFEPRGVLTFRTGFPLAMIDEKKEAPARFFTELCPRLAALPGVEAVGLVSWRPTHDDTGAVNHGVIEGEPLPVRSSEARSVHHRLATGSYFAAMRIPLQAGRLFDSALDRPDTPKVVLVDEAFAQRHFGSAAAALGKRIAGIRENKSGGTPQLTEFQEIVGVVGNVRLRLDRPDRFPTIYQSITQWTDSSFLTVVLRTRGDPATYIEAARDTVLAVNREIPIYEEGRLDDALLRSETVWPRRFFSHLFAAFGTMALFLACIGIYGVMSYNVSQRVQELGVRLALGAPPREVIRLIIRHGLGLVGYGLGAGFIAAYLLANLLRGLLYGISPHDPPTFALVPLLLALVAAVACWLPSRRATLIEPNAALRAE